MDADTQNSSNQHEETQAMPNPILQYFEYGHLRPEIQIVSSQFYILAHNLDHYLVAQPEKSVALRKLLEAKDAALRSCSQYGIVT